MRDKQQAQQEVFVGVDSGGAQTNVKIVIRRADGIGDAHYETDESLSGALERTAIPEILIRILQQLPSKLKQCGAEDLPTYIWISAAGYTEWTRQNYNKAMLGVRESLLPIRLSAIGAANDAVSLLRGTDADGVVIAGAGSNVIVQASDGQMYQSGGHEWVASDYGSGFWIGLDAIREAFRDFEAGNDSVLLKRLGEAYDVKPYDTGAMIAKMRELGVADPNLRAKIARFAKYVCDTVNDDEVSRNIVKWHAHDLAGVAAAAIQRRFTKDTHADGIRMVKSGGLMKSLFYRTAFEKQVEKLLRRESDDPVTIQWQTVLEATQPAVELAQYLCTPTMESFKQLADQFRPAVIE